MVCNLVRRGGRRQGAAGGNLVAGLSPLELRGPPAKDADDLAVARARAKESSLRFEDFLKDLKRRGKIQRSDQAVRREGTRNATRQAPAPACERIHALA